VSGKGVIRFRKVEEILNSELRILDSGKDDVPEGTDSIQNPKSKIQNSGIIEYFVSGEKLEVVDIPPGYTHNIENLGDSDMVTVMWCNEIFDPTRPDTIFENVAVL
jgi:hypothetical protein